MDLEKKFSALQLAIINNQDPLYTCACPDHVSRQITNLRKLFDFEKQCSGTPNPLDNDLHHEVHVSIAEATKKAHRIMEQCLDEILELEGWDRTKLEMPPGMR